MSDDKKRCHPFRVQAYLKPINKEFIDRLKMEMQTPSESEILEHVIETYRKNHNKNKNKY